MPMKKLGVASLPSYFFIGVSVFLTILTATLVTMSGLSTHWEKIVFQKHVILGLNTSDFNVWIPDDNDEYFLVRAPHLHRYGNESSNSSTVVDVTHCVPLIRVAGIWVSCDKLSDTLRASGCGGNYLVTTQCTVFPSFGGDLSSYTKDSPEKLHQQLTRSAQSTSAVGMICIAVGLVIGLVLAAVMKQVVAAILAGTFLIIGAVYSVFATCLMMMRAIQTARLGLDVSTEFNKLYPVVLFDNKTVTADWAMYLSWAYIVISILAGLSWFLTSYILRVKITNGNISSVWAYRQLCGLDGMVSR